MSDASFSNAMTEIALALAMAFFSVMVLAMVSMSVPHGEVAATEVEDSTLDLAPSARGNSTTLPTGDAPFLIVFHNGRFIDRDLHPIDIGNLPNSPLVLAITPNTEIATAMKIRERIRRPDLTVTTLDNRWLAALKELP